MKIGKQITEYSVTHYKLIISTMLIFAFITILGAALPSIWPETFPFLNPLKVDTDPENMLPEDEPIRVFHNQMKKEFSLNEIVVVGIVNDQHKNGVFNKSSLTKIYELAEFAKTLSWPDPKNPSLETGVIGVDLLAPSTVDIVLQGDLNSDKI